MFPQNARKILALALAAAITSTSSLFAQAVSYNDRTTFNAATTGRTIEDFTGDNQALADSITLSPFTFIGIDDTTPPTDVKVEVIEGTNVGAPGNSVLTTNTASFLENSIRIELGTGVTAFGTDFKPAGNSIIAPVQPFTFTVFFADNTSQTFPTSSSGGNNFAFFGVTSVGLDITAVEVQTSFVVGSPGTVLDNVTSGTTSLPIPEPSTWVMIGLGASLLSASWRFRRNRV
jgi:hypothetical protein